MGWPFFWARLQAGCSAVSLPNTEAKDAAAPPRAKYITGIDIDKDCSAYSNQSNGFTMKTSRVKPLLPYVSRGSTRLNFILTYRLKYILACFYGR